MSPISAVPGPVHGLPDQAAAQAPAPLRVLYVEDNAQDAALTARWLQLTAPHVTLVTVHTLAAARARLGLALPDAADPPDLLLVDVRLPDGNGLELLAEVRARAWPLGVLMLTGSGDESLAVSALRSGADDYVVKAGRYLERLGASLDAVRERRRQAPSASPAAGVIRVLLAGAPEAEARAMARQLARYTPHIQLEPVRDPRRALDLLPPLGPPAHDLLLVDASLTGLEPDQLEHVLGEVRRQRALRLPVLVLTEPGDPHHTARALRAGANDCLVRHDDLLQRLPVAIENAWFRSRLEQERGALRESEERFRQMAESIGDVFFLADPQQRRALYLSPAYERIWGEPLRAVHRHGLVWLRRVHPEDRPALLARLREGLTEPAEFGFRVCRRDGLVRDVLVRVTPMSEAGGAVAGSPRLAGVAQDVTLRREHEARIEHLAFHDALTGLPNRTLLAERLARALAQAQRENGQVAVLFLDLDRFKVINDSLGHLAGDRLLVEVGRRLRGALRAEDTLARVGGDEFQVLLPRVSDPSDAAHVAEKLMQALQPPMRLEGRDVQITASLGVALYPRDAIDNEALLTYADTALYEAKGEGRNAYRFFSPEMNAQAHGRLRVEHELRRAIAQGQLCLHWQPQMEVATGRLVAAEALVRWAHPVEGLLQPAAFIPLAEETDLIVDLGHWVLDAACAQLAAWREAGLELPRVAVNLSARQLQRPGLVAAVQQALGRHGLPASALELELTEGSVMGDPHKAAELLSVLHRLGVSLALDDFGTGYSSLVALRRLPLDRLKIDASFVQGLPHEAEDLALVETLILLARRMHLQTVAEGVETLEQQQLLRQLGCDLLQGHGLARPMAADDLARLLHAGPAQASASALALIDAARTAAGAVQPVKPTTRPSPR